MGVYRMRVVYGQGAKRQKRESKKGEKKLKRGAGRLIFCVVLFLLMYMGKGIFPKQMAHNGQKLLDVIRCNVDLEAAVQALGQSIADDKDVADSVMEFCTQVFMPGTLKTSKEDKQVQPVVQIEPRQQVDNTSNDKKVQALQNENEIDTEDVLPELSVPEVGQVLQIVETNGTSLPDGYETNVLYLGDMETVVPTAGRITSGFGYRDHPTIGRHSIHNGVDIGANTGDDICSFSDGCVTEVGENGDFGKYLSLKHANGVTSFYAHCSKIFVEKGQQVKVGERVALVGKTGQATGPHLHFELLYNGVYLDPVHYISFQ